MRFCFNFEDYTHAFTIQVLSFEDECVTTAVSDRLLTEKKKYPFVHTSIKPAAPKLQQRSRQFSQGENLN